MEYHTRNSCSMSNHCCPDTFRDILPRAFQTFGGFTSGIGICYADSAITNLKFQSIAKNLIIGQRLVPQVFLRAADGRPVEIQDLIPSDSRFKVLVFTGNSSDAGQLQKVKDVSQELEDALLRLSAGRTSLFFDTIPISSAKTTVVRYNDLPKFLWSHWSKYVFTSTALNSSSFV